MDDRFQTLERYSWWGSAVPQVGFPRPEYADKIFSYSGNRLVKVLIGQRRVGKSYILRQLARKFVEQGVDKRNIFFVNRELLDFDFLRTYQDLQELFKLYLERVQPQGRIYLFIDEIQNIDGWERFVNSYSQDFTGEYELYITGSNSRLLSGELATLLSGRYVKFEVFPCSYTEFVSVFQKAIGRTSYIEYLNGSGMPELFHLSDEEVRRNYMSALKDTVLLRDIIQRYSIKDARLLEELFIYLVNNASCLVSVRNIANYIKSKGKSTSYDTVSAYIGYIEEAFLAHRVERYNIRGKETISGNCKYYINDLGFNNYLYRGFGYGTGYQLENLVYLDLLRSGFQVYTGNVKDKEVDFVAMKGDRVIYIQSTYMLIDQDTIEREYSALEAIEDHYEKWVVSLDEVALPLRNGIRHVPAWHLAELLVMH